MPGRTPNRAIFETFAGDLTMAKGQLRGNKEAKKPKKPKQAPAPAGSVIPQTKPIKPGTAKPG